MSERSSVAKSRVPSARLAAGKRALLVSIQPKYVDLILSGAKRVELRRRFDAGAAGCPMLIYATLPVGAVVGWTTVQTVQHLPLEELWSKVGDFAAVNRADFLSYFSGLTHGYGLELGSVERYRSQVSLSELRYIHSVSPPQSYRYLEIGHSLAHHERN